MGSQIPTSLAQLNPFSSGASLPSGVGGGGGFFGGMPASAGNWGPALNRAGLGGGSSPVGSVLGTSGGAGGTGFDKPGMPTLQQAYTPQDIQTAQQNAQNQLGSQQALLQALQAQNALGAQSTVQGQQQDLANQLGANNGAGNLGQAYNAQTGLNSQLAAANGVGTQNAAIQGLQGLSGQYANIAAGGGPNPAQAMLNQQTGQNVANQAALMAGQRGAGANVGLMARQAAQQGAATQQQAVGQGAAMEAQQQLAAMGQQAGIQQALGGLGTTQAGMQQAGIQNQASQAAQQVAAQQAAQQAAANQANTMAANQLATQQSAVQGNLANVGQMQGALGQYNQAQVGAQGSVNAANAALAQARMGAQNNLAGGLINWAGPAVAGALGGGMFGGSGAGALGAGAAGALDAGAGGGGAAVGDAAEYAPDILTAAHGGEIKKPKPRKMAYGGDPAPQAMPMQQPMMGPQSSFGQFLAAYKTPTSSAGEDPQDTSGARGIYQAENNPGNQLAQILASKGGEIDYRGGGKVRAETPKEKPVIKGDSEKNDKIPAMLSDGEFVIKRSAMRSKESAMKFVADHFDRMGK